MIIKLDENALIAAGFTKSHVVLMRHLVAQIGLETGGTTLPEVAELVDTLTPIVDGLVITLTATNVAVGDLQVNEADLPPSNNHLIRRMEDMQAEFDGSRIERSALVQATEDMKAEAERSAVIDSRILTALDELRSETDAQNLNIADLRRRISQLEDAQT